MKKQVLICGGSGLLGTYLCASFEQAGFSVLPAGFAKEARLRADLRDRSQTFRLLDEVRPDLVVNLVAATNVDACETAPNEAYLLNARVVENIADWLTDHADVRLVQISTDHVYNSPGNALNREADVALTNYYAYSKYLGERAALAAGGMVLRTNFFGRSLAPGRESLTDWLHRVLTTGAPFTLLTDVHFTPLSLRTLGELIVRIAHDPKPGVFNLGSVGGMSKAQFGLEFARLLGLSTEKAALASAEGFFKVYRPRNMLMDCSAVTRTFGLTLPSLSDQLSLVSKDYVV